ncbi:MAG: hypothetical protein M1396_02495 [Chloroflexi bacterium]|nr:hypothetical protein [Chloroflexota bacterium]
MERPVEPPPSGGIHVPTPVAARIPLAALIKMIGQELTTAANQLREPPAGTQPGEAFTFQLSQVTFDLALNTQFEEGQVLVSPVEIGQVAPVSHLTLQFNPLPAVAGS